MKAISFNPRWFFYPFNKANSVINHNPAKNIRPDNRETNTSIFTLIYFCILIIYNTLNPNILQSQARIEDHNIPDKNKNASLKQNSALQKMKNVPKFIH